MSKQSNANVEDFLFGHGLTLGDYFIEKSPVSEIICYRNSEGREFDLYIGDHELASASIERLRELGVKVVVLK